ncbi:MAG: UDP-N-acetylglucosamine 2-epimerase (non-hydrolyzing) [Gammaproteobacteria bacterium]|nr:UDP-N-acetylglucosamine 2-epimerase (non-hydrolyzing) [Gammaproteobacteria bacterium]
MKIITIIGARPQFVKASSVSRILSKNDSIQEVLVHTGQHYDNEMSSVFFDELDIPEPHYNLGIGSDTHSKQTGRMLQSIDDVLIKEKPDWVLVYGDTNSTLAGALAAAKLHIPVAHVEAGLRSYNRKMPEELNRILTDHASNMLFTPTITAVNNLENEGILKNKIKLVGDVMYDSSVFFLERAQLKSNILELYKIQSQSYVLATIHRAENTNSQQKLKEIFNALIEIASNTTVVVPLHPRTRKYLKNYDFLDSVKKRLFVINPVGYLDMLMLEKHANVIVTDSGGVQKEAYFYKVPCVVTREETEWAELEKSGAVKLVGTCKNKITEAVSVASFPGTISDHLYGKGNASNLIVSHLLA